MGASGDFNHQNQDFSHQSRFHQIGQQKGSKLSHQDEGNGPTLSFEGETIGNDFVGVTCFFDVPPRIGMMVHNDNDELF